MKENFDRLVDDPSIILNGTNANPIKSKDLIEAEAVVNMDIGNLQAFDPRPVDISLLKKQTDENLRKMCKISTQLIINSLFNLPTETVDDVIVAKLPKPTTVLPREKPLPKEKPPTKWEQYAKLKGIAKKKKSRMEYDEVKGEWRPRWGYKRSNETTKDWCIEIKKNEDPMQDFFAKKTEEKNERKAKNEFQRLRNINRQLKNKKFSRSGKIPKKLKKTRK